MTFQIQEGSDVRCFWCCNFQVDELLKARDKIHDSFTANPSPKRTSSGANLKVASDDSKSMKHAKDGSEEEGVSEDLPTDSNSNSKEKEKEKEKDKDRAKSSKKKWPNLFYKGDGKVP